MDTDEGFSYRLFRQNLGWEARHFLSCTELRLQVFVAFVRVSASENVCMCELVCITYRGPCIAAGGPGLRILPGQQAPPSLPILKEPIQSLFYTSICCREGNVGFKMCQKQNLSEQNLRKLTKDKLPIIISPFYHFIFSCFSLTTGLMYYFLQKWNIFQCGAFYSVGLKSDNFLCI